MQYVEHTYVLGRPARSGRRMIGPTFAPELWSVHDNVLRRIPRTTNNHESWHSRMAKLINIKRVRVWKLIEALKLEQKSAEGRVLVTQAGLQPKRRTKGERKDRGLRNVCTSYIHMNPLRYLDSVASHLGCESAVM